MSSFLERTNAKRIANGLEPIAPIVVPPRKPYVFVMEDFVANLHKLAPYIYRWSSPQGLEYLVKLCKECGFQGTKEEILETFHSLYPASLTCNPLLDPTN